MPRPKNSRLRPNIIFILADDLGFGDLGCYGQSLIRTPNLDRMAEEGMRFTRHYSGGPVCGPSRACLMTGRHQGSGYIKGNPVQGNDIPFRPEDTTLAEVLQRAGYETACIGKWGLGKGGTSGFPTAKGFDYFYGYDSHKAAHDYYPATLWRNESLVDVPPGAYSHDLFTEEALAWLRRGRVQPFMLYLAYTIPHSPYNPPDSEPYSDMEWPESYRNYAAMITRMDRDIGKLQHALRELGIDENTLVVFASDNGPGSEYTPEIREMVKFFRSAGPYRGMKRDVYDGGIHVPMLVRWPGVVQAGAVSEHVCGFQDFLPTLAELAGAEVPTAVDGLSMAPTWLGLEDRRQAVHEELYWEFISMGAVRKGRQSAIDVRTGWKVVRYGSQGAPELYRLTDDESESNDVAALFPEVALRMAARLDALRGPSELWPMPETGDKPPV
ncbi:arylsulfatase [Paenibacillus koleovorans]|uniref:arylsulfatase n=1 Tax=Paenibacillus koleovorans TaxID=121608 RepID=UPI000FDB0197|nr:arylsulfatase [Paenibacillus koleovorans]